MSEKASKLRAEHLLSLSESAAHPGDSEKYAALALREPQASPIVRAVARQRWIDGAIERRDWKLVESLAAHPDCAPPDRIRARTLLGVRRWSVPSIGALALWALCALLGWLRNPNDAARSLRTHFLRPLGVTVVVSMAGVLAAVGFRADPAPFFGIGIGAFVISCASLGLLGLAKSFARSVWIRGAVAMLTASAVLAFAFLLVAYRFPPYLSVFGF